VKRLYNELKRRNVFGVAAAYLVFAWFILQVADIFFPLLSLPEWSTRLLAALLAIGVLPTLIVSWVYELTPEGLKRESTIDPKRSNTAHTSQRLNLITIVMVVLAVGVLLADRYLLDRHGFESELVSGPGMPVIDIGEGAFNDEVTPVVAVLPFKAIGSDDGGFLAAGLYDDLLTRLTKLKAFRVISRTSMMEYAETGKNMRQIGEELGAGYILEGGVQSIGSRVRINAQLIDARADEHIWADTFDRELTATDMFDIQAELANSIAGQLKITLNQEDQALMDEVPTQNTEAYTAYLRGLDLHLSGVFSAANERMIVNEFEGAVRLDPQFALAWARLSIARSRLAQITDDAEVRESALSALARAQALQPGLYETSLAWAVYLYRGQLEYEQALEAMEVLSERTSLDAETLQIKAWLTKRVGRYRDAYLTMLQARKLEPRGISITQSLVTMAWMSDDCAAASEHAMELLSLAPGYVASKITLAEYELECTGNAQRANELLRNQTFEANFETDIANDAAKAARDYDRLIEISHMGYPNPSQLTEVYVFLSRSEALSKLGRREEALNNLNHVNDMLMALDNDDLVDDSLAFTRARYFAQRGEVELTLKWIEQGWQEIREVTNNDQYILSITRFYVADTLAKVGLHDESIEELRIMLENPGGRGFRYVESRPEFDSVRLEPAYIALRKRFGNVR
jgi:TolB-like protein